MTQQWENSYLSHRFIDRFPRILKLQDYTSFVRPEGPKDRANKTCFNFMILILIFMENFSNTMLFMIY